MEQWNLYVTACFQFCLKQINQSMHKQASSLSLLTIISTALGACLEWFDFSIFIYVTPMIAANFFPHENKFVSVIASFGIFAAGYLMRPLGGIIFGNLGDKLGRKKILKITTGLMAVPMLITAVLPTYAMWGGVAVILLLLMRMLQGFSVGGEYTGVLVMLLEQAPLRRRGAITSLATFISGFGVLLSSLLVTCLISILGEHAMYVWGWRLPFFIGFVLAVFAYVMQCFIKESPYFEDAKKQHKLVKLPVLHALRLYPKQMFFVFVLTGFLGIAYYMGAAFLPSYLISILHLPKLEIMRVTTLAAALYALVAPLSGFVSDYIGRKPILLVATLLLAILIYPFFLIIASGNMAYITIANCVYMAIVAIDTAVFVTCINELFPTEERFSGMSASYNVGNAIFGGTTPLVAAWFISLFGSHFAPSYYLMIAAMFTVGMVCLMPETNRFKVSN